MQIFLIIYNEFETTDVSILSVLIWVQRLSADGKGYQQMTKVPASLKKVNHTEFFQILF